jgi:CRP-like cAMP-binding protein
VILTHVKNCFLFEGFSAAQLEEIYRLAREQSFVAGEKIITAHEPNDSLWILVEGHAVVHDVLPEGLEFDVHRLKSGEIVGEYSFLDTSPASASVVAQDLCRFLRFRFDALEEFYKRHPDAELKTQKSLSRRLVSRLRQTQAEIRKSFLLSLGWSPDRG